MRAINAAVTALADKPDPPEAFIRSTYRRLHVGAYRILYSLEGDFITIMRVDRIIGG